MNKQNRLNNTRSYQNYHGVWWLMPVRLLDHRCRNSGQCVCDIASCALQHLVHINQAINRCVAHVLCSCFSLNQHGSRSASKKPADRHLIARNHLDRLQTSHASSSSTGCQPTRCSAGISTASPNVQRQQLHACSPGVTLATTTAAAPATADSGRCAAFGLSSRCASRL
jgi:hypothetical protein